MRWALLPILWAALLLPSSNVGWFDGLPLDTGPELIGLLLLLPLTVSRALRRHWRRLIGACGPIVFTVLLALGLLAVGGKLALLASGTYEGFLGCYRYALAPPPRGPCERAFANPWFRHSVTRIDRTIDFDPETWNLGWVNSNRFIFQGRPVSIHPWRERLPLEVRWGGVVELPTPWIARVTYVGEVTVRLSREKAHAGTVIMLPPRYGETVTADVPVAAGRHWLELTYRFDDGARRPAPRPSGTWATLRLARLSGEAGARDTLAVAARAETGWRILAAAVDWSTVLLGATLVLGYAALLRRDWWLAVLVAVAGQMVSRLHPESVGLPIAFAAFVCLLGLALTLLARPWRRRLVLAFLGTAYLNLCLVLSSTDQLDMVLQRPLSDAVMYESQARAILDTGSLEGGEPVFRFQPGFRYWRFLERLVLGEGDPFVVIVALTVLTWGFLWAIAHLWPRPAPTWSRVLPFVVGMALGIGLVTSTPVLAFIEAPLSEYPTWVLLPLTFTLLFATRTAGQWASGGILGAVAVLCRLNHLLAMFGYLAVFGRQRWRGSPRAVAVTIGLVLAMLTLPPLHNRYYGGPATETSRIMNVNRRALAISPAQLPDLYRDPETRRKLWGLLAGILNIPESPEAKEGGDGFTRGTMRGIQGLWVATAIVVLPRRRMQPGAKALLLVPLLYLIVHLVYAVDIYYPRHIVAGHLALAISVLYVVGRGWAGGETRGGSPPGRPETGGGPGASGVPAGSS